MNTKFILFGFYLVLLGCVNSQNQDSVKCNNVACDTINTYSFTQICNDTIINYNLTYTDTVKLIRSDGEAYFSIWRCQNCKGIQDVPILSKSNKLIQKIKVTHSGGGKSEMIALKSLNPYLDSMVKVNWTEHGKVFYIEKQLEPVLVYGLVFGRFCGECGGNCAPMFRLNTGGNASVLWADYDNNYFEGDSALKFETDMNTRKNIGIAYEVMWKLPKSLREWKNDTHTFGCPDCNDGCGIYVEFKVDLKTGQRKRFRIDLGESDKVPKEITDYANYISQKVNELMK